MTQATLTRTANADKKATRITADAIALINSLGGPQMSIPKSVEHFQVSLENQAAAQTPVWTLNVLDQALRQQGFRMPSAI